MKLAKILLLWAILVSFALHTQAQDTSGAGSLDSLLLEALKANDLPQVKSLVAQGANVNAEFVGYTDRGTDYKAPLLMFAGAYSDLETVKYLISQKVDYKNKGLLNIQKKNVIYGSLLVLAAGEEK